MTNKQNNLNNDERELTNMIEISRHPLPGDILVYDASDKKFKPMSLTEYFKKYPVVIDAT